MGKGEKTKKNFISLKAITRIQVIVVILVVIIASISGILYYTHLNSETNPAQFSMIVTSRPFLPIKGEKEVPIAMPGQRVVFLVIVHDTGDGNGYGKDVDISVTASGAETLVSNPTVKPGEVAEVIIIPDQTCLGKILTINIQGQRNGYTQSKTVDIEVVDWQDDLGEVAAEMRDKFIPWLENNHPELGITSKTEWEGTIVNPGILVVMHYIFYCDDWELYVTWHVMIPPYDWSRIYLRSRFTETQSTMAFEISSVQGEETLHSIELPDWV